QVLASQRPGTAPQWLNRGSANVLLSSTNTWTATQMYVSSIAVSAPGGVGVTYGVVAGSLTANDLSVSQFVKTDANRKLISQNKIDLSADVTGALPASSLSGNNLPGGSTSYIQVTSALHARSTFYVSSGTINNFIVVTSISLPAGTISDAHLASFLTSPG